MTDSVPPAQAATPQLPSIAVAAVPTPPRNIERRLRRAFSTDSKWGWPAPWWSPSFPAKEWFTSSFTEGSLVGWPVSLENHHEAAVTAMCQSHDGRRRAGHELLAPAARAVDNHGHELTCRTPMKTVAALLLLLPALCGCAVVTVAGAVAGAAISVTGAVVGAGVKVTGKVIEKTIDVATPDSDDETVKED